MLVPPKTSTENQCPNLMKNTRIYVIVLLFTFFSAKAQLFNPVKWQAKIEKKSGSDYLLTFSGTMEKEWHLYSQFTAEGGPMPLKLQFSGGKDTYITVGKAKESRTTTMFSKAFGVKETYFQGNFTIRQAIRIRQAAAPIVADLSYQVCREVCIPQKRRFKFDPKHLKSEEVVSKKAKIGSN
jgi:cytochrome c biogenesis DsbD-like protein